MCVIDTKQKQRLDAVARKTGRPAAFYLRRALDAHLDQLQYIYAREKDAKAARRGEIDTTNVRQSASWNVNFTPRARTGVAQTRSPQPAIHHGILMRRLLPQ
ncbi:type II toxin-antitoxin system RelB family antitoxin [Corynebacterium tapiri]|uniref:type II toxin-antitoxin system RelB family antitoxin n=1 Tax=Corynebacterium tapiri TaxID=1448266 RepID=UPI003CCC76C2